MPGRGGMVNSGPVRPLQRVATKTAKKLFPSVERFTRIEQRMSTSNIERFTRVEQRSVGVQIIIRKAAVQDVAIVEEQDEGSAATARNGPDSDERIEGIEIQQGGQSSDAARPTLSLHISNLIRDGQRAPGFHDEDMLLEGFPEDAELNVIASAEAIRREAEVSSDQGITNLDSQVVGGGAGHGASSNQGILGIEDLEDQVGGDGAGHGAKGALSDQDIDIEGINPVMSIFKTSHRLIPLLSDDNFGAGKKPSLVRLSELLLSGSNLDRIKQLIESGWMDSTDTEVVGAMLNFRHFDWEELISKLLKVQIVPNETSLLEMEVSAKNPHQKQQLDSDPKRPLARVISHVEQRFNGIVAASQRKFIRFERFSVPNMIVRNQPLLPTDTGLLSTLCWAVAVQGSSRTPVVMKIRNAETEDAESATQHEYKVLRYLQKVHGIPKLHGDGILVSNHSSFLVMRKESSDYRCLETLSVRGLVRVIHSAYSIISKIHANGLLYLNLYPYNLLFDSDSQELVLAGLQYASIDPNAPERTRQRCRDSDIDAQSPLKAKPININAMDNSPKNRAHDSFNMGAMLIVLLSRNLQLFSKRRMTDLSPLENLSQEEIVALITKHAETFNSFLHVNSERLKQPDISLLIQLGCGLLHADPNLRFSCEAALAMLSPEAIPHEPHTTFPDMIIVPSKLVEPLQEMQRATKIKTTFDCVDFEGNVIQGKGLWSFGVARAGDLLNVYSGLVYTKQEGDIMSARGQGTNLKSIKINGQDMVLDARWRNNGCADIFFFVANGAAGLANCNASVHVKRDGKGGKRITVSRFPANAYFEKLTLSQPYRLPVPGCHLSKEMIVLRAARDLEDDEQIFVDYGTGTMMNMFGLSSGEIVISKPVDKKTAGANPKRKLPKKSVESVAKHGVAAKTKRQRAKA